jgi:hypothetical protein
MRRKRKSGRGIKLGRNKVAKQTAKPKSERSVVRWLPGLLGAAITVLTLYPFLAVQQGDAIDPRNPYSSMFSVVNKGFFPVTDLDVDCLPEMDVGKNFSLGNNRIVYERFGKYLPHEGQVTIPCFKVLSFGGGDDLPSALNVNLDPKILRSAKLTIKISYSFFPVTWRKLRRNQTFQFTALKNSTGQWVWTFVS